MFLRLLSPRQRSARALLLSSQHATRFHDAEAFRATTTSPVSSSAQFRFRHVPASWPMTRPVAVANKSLSAASDLASLPLRARVDARTRTAVHSCARRSLIPITSSPVRLFSALPSRRTVSMGAQDASVLQDDGRNGNGIPAQDGLDPESEEEVPIEAEELQDALTRPPAVNSSYLPLPWKGRLGYVSFICALSCYVYMLMRTGLFEYVSALLKPSRVLLANMSHSFYPRKSPSAARSFPTASSNQEPTRPESTRRCRPRSGVCRGIGVDQCSRSRETAEMERPLWDQVHAFEQ